MGNAFPQNCGKVFLMGNVFPQNCGKVFLMGNMLPQNCGKVFLMGNVFPQNCGKRFLMGNAPVKAGVAGLVPKAPSKHWEAAGCGSKIFAEAGGIGIIALIKNLSFKAFTNRQRNKYRNFLRACQGGFCDFFAFAGGMRRKMQKKQQKYALHVFFCDKVRLICRKQKNGGFPCQQKCSHQ